jgi:hypothetical protein
VTKEIEMRQWLAAGLVVVAGFAAVAHAQQTAVGTWAMTVQSPISETKSTLIIREDGGALKAFARGEQGERPYDKIEVAGDKITMVLTISYEGSPMVITYTGTVDKGKMGGDADFGGLATGTWSATAQ